MIVNLKERDLPASLFLARAYADIGSATTQEEATGNIEGFCRYFIPLFLGDTTFAELFNSRERFVELVWFSMVVSVDWRCAARRVTWYASKSTSPSAGTSGICAKHICCFAPRFQEMWERR